MAVMKMWRTLTQQILSALRIGNYDELPAPMKESLHMIASKMARIVNGDPEYLDNWHDIGGYAKLIEKLIKGELTMDKLKWRMNTRWSIYKKDGISTMMFLLLKRGNTPDAMQAEAENREPSGLPEALWSWCFAPLSHAWQMVDGHAWINSHGPMGNAPPFGFTGSHIMERPDGF